MRLEVFKSNQHPQLTATAVRQLIADYDPALHKAPLTIGHVSDPKAPAWGWAETLAFDEPTMAGEFGDVDPDFETLWNAGHYRNISAAFYPPGHADNPLSQVGKTGYYPHHFAALGATAPKIKGLKNPTKFSQALTFGEGDLTGLVVVEFADPNPDFQEPEDAIYVGSEDETVIELDVSSQPDPGEPGEIIENAEVSGYTLTEFMRGMREYIIERDGVERADRIVPDYFIQEIMLPEEPLVDEPAPMNFSEGDGMTPDIEAREAALAKREANIRRVELTQFCETDLAKKLHPSQQGSVVELMLFCESQSEALITFSEGGEEVSKTPSNLLKSFLQSLPELVEFSELGGDMPLDLSGDPTAMAYAIQAKQAELAAQGRIVSATEAAAMLSL